MTIIALLSTGENPASQRIQRGIRYLNRELVRDPNGLFGYRAPNLRGAPGFENAVSTPATYYALLALLTYLDYAGEGGRPVFPPINWRSVLINGVPLLGFVAFTLMAAYYLFQLGSSNSALLFSILGLIGMIVSGTFLIRGRSRR